MSYDIIGAIKLISISILPIATIFLVGVMRSLKIYLLSEFQIHKSVLLTLVTLLYVRFSELTCLVTEGLYHLANISPLSPTPSPRQPPF